MTPLIRPKPSSTAPFACSTTIVFARRFGRPPTSPSRISRLHLNEVLSHRWLADLWRLWLSDHVSTVAGGELLNMLTFPLDMSATNATNATDSGPKRSASAPSAMLLSACLAFVGTLCTGKPTHLAACKPTPTSDPLRLEIPTLITIPSVWLTTRITDHRPCFQALVGKPG